MENSIILQNLNLQQLEDLITKGLKSQIDELKKHLNNTEELLTREQACEFLQIDSSTLWHWGKKGKVIAYGIGNRRYYKKAELLGSLIQLKK